MKALLRQLRGPLVCLAVYAVLLAVFNTAFAHEGLVSPDGALDLRNAVATATIIGARLLVLFVVLPWAAYRALRAVMTRA